MWARSDEKASTELPLHAADAEPRLYAAPATSQSRRMKRRPPFPDFGVAGIVFLGRCGMERVGAQVGSVSVRA